MFFFFHYSNILIQGMALQILPIVWIWAFWYNKAPAPISSAAQCDAVAAVGIMRNFSKLTHRYLLQQSLSLIKGMLFKHYIWNSIPCMRETVVVGTYVWASKNSSTPLRRSKHNTDSRNRVAFSRWRNYSQGIIVQKMYFLITT